jgi:hypothetical protein
MSTMKITETGTGTQIEGEGVEINREGKDWYFDTDASRTYFAQVLEPYEGERVTLRLSIEYPVEQKPEPKKKAD